jgi:hypothetical protein
MIEFMTTGLDELAHYYERPEIEEIFKIPDQIEVVLTLLTNAGIYLGDQGRTEVVLKSDETVDKVKHLVNKFVNHTIDFMTQV